VLRGTEDVLGVAECGCSGGADRRAKAARRDTRITKGTQKTAFILVQSCALGVRVFRAFRDFYRFVIEKPDQKTGSAC
jgi:hypothetical protein